jgi:hypothetical protein
MTRARAGNGGKEVRGVKCELRMRNEIHELRIGGTAGFGNALSTDWIPAFAGMTAWSVGGGEGQGLADVFGFELRALAIGAGPVGATQSRIRDSRFQDSGFMRRRGPTGSLFNRPWWDGENEGRASGAEGGVHA